MILDVVTTKWRHYAQGLLEFGNQFVSGKYLYLYQNILLL